MIDIAVAPRTFWDTVFRIATVAAMVFGGLSVGAAFLSAWVGYRLTDTAQKDANQRIADAHAVAAAANENAATANLRAAALEHQNLILREKFASRRITEEQHRVLVGVLSKHPAAFDIEVMSDPESGMFASDILTTFIDAGWKVERKTFPLGVIWHGLNVFRTRDPANRLVIEALETAGIPYSIASESRDRPTIMVGGKPRTF